MVAFGNDIQGFDEILASGQWTGFFLEDHRQDRGWMHLYLEFDDSRITGEGTDYVGPWHINGTYDAARRTCSWVKQYLNKHQVTYSGEITENGILGNWKLSHGLSIGTFHIWPQRMAELQHLYLKQDLEFGHRA